jgi:hypothetical protein
MPPPTQIFLTSSFSALDAGAAASVVPHTPACAGITAHLLDTPSLVYVSIGDISGSEFIPLPDASSMEVSAYFSFVDLPVQNVWAVLFEFGGKAFLHADLGVCAPLLYPNMDKAMVLPLSPQLSSFSEYPHEMLLPADHGDDALCYHVNICTMESDNKIAVLMCVLQSGSWAIRCIAKGLLAKSRVEILLTTVLASSKIYMANVIPNLGKCMPNF